MLLGYKAKSKTGEVIEGVLDAKDRFALARELRARELTPFSIKEKKENSLLIKSVQYVFY